MSAPEYSAAFIGPRLDSKAISRTTARARSETTTLVGREYRLDMFRGLALVMIFFDHVPGTFYENLTLRNWGFSDSAEAFVFMSGMAAGLAYSSRFINGPLWLAAAKVWARARQLYFVHITITALALAVFAAGASWMNLPDLLSRNNLAPIFEQPLDTIMGIPALTHQLGYVNILPLYAVLLLATPLFLVIGVRWPGLLLALSVIVWVIAGQFRLNFPNYPGEGGWFFNPLSWQLIFVVGLLSGCATKQGTAFVPFKQWLFWLATGFLVLAVCWTRFPVVGEWGNDVLAVFDRMGVPFYVIGFDKTFLTAPRLLHALALFYFVSCLPWIVGMAQSRLAQPLTLLGRYGLAVFATGSVVCIMLQVLKEKLDPNFFGDSALLAIGLAAQLVLALALAKTAAMRSASLSGGASPNV